MSSFILRQCADDGETTNIIFDSNYTIVWRHIDDSGKFPLACKSFSWTPKEIPDSCFAMIQSPNELWPLYNDFHYYMMTESGKTFERITCPPAFKKKC